jgi:amidophosphoribosyltransferase
VPRPASPLHFEYIYFARSDSQLDQVSVHESRLRAGRLLARQFPVEADIVLGVPDSGLDAAMGYSQESGIPLVRGFVKNNYIGRTFIKPTQSQRENAVRIKLNPVRSSVAGKRVVKLDDSIVRGTTSARIVQQLKQAGAAEVHVRISAPPFLWPCYFAQTSHRRTS